MSRVGDLKHQNDLVKKTNKTGPYAYRLARHQTINRFIIAFSATRQVPIKWHAVNKDDILRAVNYWRMQKKKDSTIMKYISQLKSFLNVIGHKIEGIDYKSLGLDKIIQPSDHSISHEAVELIRDPLIKNIILLQIKFGLTFAEAVRFAPDIHANQDGLWLTREITRNSLDRTIKYQNEQQQQIIKELSEQLGCCESARSRFGYHEIRALYRVSLGMVGLKSSINYRAIYARERFITLTDEVQEKKAKEIIMDEMGISSSTLRRFLNESN